MNEQTPQAEETPKKYHWGRFWIGLLVVIGFFIVRGLFINSQPFKEYINNDQQIPLDYDLVMRTPNLFIGEKAYLEGTLFQVVPTSPDVTSKDIYLIVSEKDNADHKWLVYGPFDVKDVSRLQEGMDIIADGICNGTISLTNKAGFENILPTIAFVDLQFGYLFESNNP